MKEKNICILYSEEHGFDDIYTFKIKGKDKKICKGCATEIKGLA